MTTKKSSFDEIIEQLNENIWFMRSEAAKQLGECGLPEAVPHLIRALGDKHEQVRISAVESLQKIGDRQAVPELIACLGKESHFFKAAVIRALSSMPDPAAFEALKPLLSHERMEIRALAVEAIGKTRHKNAHEPLVRMLAEEQPLPVRCNAVRALGDLGDPRAIDVLISVMTTEESRFIRREIPPALRKIGEGNDILAYRHALSSEKWEIRNDAVAALATLNGESVVEPLVIALKDPDRYIRKEALIALMRMRPIDGEGGLVSLIALHIGPCPPEIKRNVLITLQEAKQQAMYDTLYASWPELKIAYPDGIKDDWDDEDL